MKPDYKKELAKLTDEQREFLRTLPMSGSFRVVCRDVQCSKCPLKKYDGCLRLMRIELMRRAAEEEAEKYKAVVEAAKAFVEWLTTRQYTTMTNGKDFTFRIAELEAAIKAVE